MSLLIGRVVPFLSHFYVTLRCIVSLLCFMSNDIKCQLVLINKLKHKYINTPKYKLQWMDEWISSSSKKQHLPIFIVCLCQLLDNLSCENYFLKWKKQQIILAPKNYAKKKKKWTDLKQNGKKRPGDNFLSFHWISESEGFIF